MPEYPRGQILLREKQGKYYYHDTTSWILIDSNYTILLSIDHYSVQSLFVQAWFVATTTPCNCAACHQYEQYKSRLFTILPNTMKSINI
jgi:hypothetical protein